MVPLTLGVPLSGYTNRLSIRRGLRCSWGDTTIWDRFSLSPNKLTASAAGNRMLNPSRTRYHISLRMNTFISGVHTDE